MATWRFGSAFGSGLRRSAQAAEGVGAVDVPAAGSGVWIDRLAAAFAVLALSAITLYLGWRLFQVEGGGGWSAVVGTLSGNAFWIAVAVGILAQLVDGALGMAYGITATTFLLTSGVSPAVASASVHLSEVFTTGFSGLSHLRFGNVNRQLFLKLLVPGMIGGVVGAVVVTQVDGAILKPFVAAYLLLIGVHVLIRGLRRWKPAARLPRRIGRLALFGGFVDSVGGGGWGPVVTTTLIGSGNDPRTTIGSVNFAEFFLSLASAGAFTVLVGTGMWPTVAGLILGGLFAAPFGALLCRRLSARGLMILVGVLISGLSIFNLLRALH